MSARGGARIGRADERGRRLGSSGPDAATLPTVRGTSRAEEHSTTRQSGPSALDGQGWLHNGTRTRSWVHRLRQQRCRHTAALPWGETRVLGACCRAAARRQGGQTVLWPRAHGNAGRRPEQRSAAPCRLVAPRGGRRSPAGWRAVRPRRRAAGQTTARSRPLAHRQFMTKGHALSRLGQRGAPGQAGGGMAAPRGVLGVHGLSGHEGARRPAGSAARRSLMKGRPGVQGVRGAVVLQDPARQAFCGGKRGNGGAHEELDLEGEGVGAVAAASGRAPRLQRSTWLDHLGQRSLSLLKPACGISEGIDATVNCSRTGVLLTVRARLSRMQARTRSWGEERGGSKEEGKRKSDRSTPGSSV